MRPHSRLEITDASQVPERYRAVVEQGLAALSAGSTSGRRRPRKPPRKSGGSAATPKPKPEPVPCTHEGCPGPCTEYSVYRLIWDGRPTTTNGNLKGEIRSKIAAEREIHQRIALMLASTPIPTVARAVIEVRGYLPNKASPWDWDGTSLWVKAVQDALVTAGVLPTDTWRHALGGMQWAVAVDSEGPARVELDVIANPPYVRLDTGGDATVVVVSEPK